MVAKTIGRGAKDIVHKKPFCRNHHCEKVRTEERLPLAQKLILFLLFILACFHPNWSKGTAAIRGTRILNHGRYYWEIHVSHRVFGTRYFVYCVSVKLGHNFTHLSIPTV